MQKHEDNEIFSQAYWRAQVTFNGLGHSLQIEQNHGWSSDGHYSLRHTSCVVQVSVISFRMTASFMISCSLTHK